MKFNPLICPECGDLAAGTLDTIPGVALLHVDPVTGEAEYAGSTDVSWDDQTTIRDSHGRYILTCGNGHEWAAERHD